MWIHSHCVIDEMLSVACCSHWVIDGRLGGGCCRREKKMCFEGVERGMLGQGERKALVLNSWSVDTVLKSAGVENRFSSGTRDGKRNDVVGNGGDEEGRLLFTSPHHNHHHQHPHHLLWPHMDVSML